MTASAPQAAQQRRFGDEPDHPVSAREHAYRDQSTTFEGYLAHPEGSRGQLPCIVLGHDWSGLNETTRLIARQLAGLGYAVFAVDVYGQGVRGDELGDNASLMAPLMADRGLLLRRLLRGLEEARGLDVVAADKLAAFGFCFGGLCALDLARADPDGLSAAISIHGGLTPPEGHSRRPIHSQICLLHGWEDPIAPPDELCAIAAELTEAEADWRLHAFGHAEHAFTFTKANAPEKGIVYHDKAARLAWRLATEFLAETLRQSNPAR